MTDNTDTPEVRSGIAAMMLVQFIAQIEEFEAMNRKARRTEHGRDLAARIDTLREGRAKWERILEAARVREKDDTTDAKHATLDE